LERAYNEKDSKDIAGEKYYCKKPISLQEYLERMLYELYQWIINDK
jgi:hypothetical protein